MCQDTEMTAVISDSSRQERTLSRVASSCRAAPWQTVLPCTAAALGTAAACSSSAASASSCWALRFFPCFLPALSAAGTVASCANRITASQRGDCTRAACNAQAAAVAKPVIHSHMHRRNEPQHPVRTHTWWTNRSSMAGELPGAEGLDCGRQGSRRSRASQVQHLAAGCSHLRSRQSGAQDDCSTD